MTTTDIYEHLRGKTEQTTGQYQINTFAVLADNALLNTPSLEKTIEYAAQENQKYFFSRDWQGEGFDENNITWSYPLLFVNQDEVNLQNPFKKSGKRFYKFDFYLLDKIDTVFEAKDLAIENMFISWLQSFDANVVKRIRDRKNLRLERIRHNIASDKLSGVMCQSVLIELNNCI